MAKAASRFIFVEINTTGGILLEPFLLLVTFFFFAPSLFRAILHAAFPFLHGTEIERHVKHYVEAFNRMVQYRNR